jgi:CheY-like chemotaxis protein
MTDEVQRRAFDPFFTTKGAHGNGLGLSSVSGILRDLGGAIQLTSRVGEGTCFTIELQAWSGEMSGADAAQGPAPAAKRAYNLLIVDDNQTALENLREILEALDQRVVAVDTGAAAVRALSGEAIDAGNTDLGMPEVNGWEVARTALERHPGVPVILCTGWSDEIDEQDLRQRGLWRLLPKPYSMKQIEDAIRDIGARAQATAA